MKASANLHNQINVNHMLLQQCTPSLQYCSFKDNINILRVLFSPVWIHTWAILSVNAKDFQPTSDIWAANQHKHVWQLDNLTASISSIFYVIGEVGNGLDQAFIPVHFSKGLEVVRLTKSSRILIKKCLTFLIDRRQTDIQPLLRQTNEPWAA